MKKIAIIIVLVLFLKPVFPVIEYAVNYDYISQVLCINKDKPALKCNGKCHLMQELAKASTDDNKADSSTSNNKKSNTNTLNDLFVQDVNLFTFGTGFFSGSIEYNTMYSNFYSRLDSYSIFHPPIFIS